MACRRQARIAGSTHKSDLRDRNGGARCRAFHRPMTRGLAMVLIMASAAAQSALGQPTLPQAPASSTGQIEGAGAGARPAPFPISHSLAAIGRWTRANTHLTLEDVAVVSDDFLFAMRERSRSNTSDGVVAELEVHEEILSPAFAKQAHARSVQMTMSVQCSNRRLKIDALTFYPDVDLAGTPETAAPRSGWVQAPEGDFAAELLHAVCDPNYRRPFAGRPAAEARAHSSVPSPAPNPQTRVAALQGAPLSQSPPYAGGRDAARISAAPASGRPHSVRLGAFSSLPNAEHALKNVQAIVKKYDGIHSSITPHKIGEKTLYFAQISDFQTDILASMFCEELQKMKLDCLKLK